MHIVPAHVLADKREAWVHSHLGGRERARVQSQTAADEREAYWHIFNMDFIVYILYCLCGKHIEIHVRFLLLNNTFVN